MEKGRANKINMRPFLWSVRLSDMTIPKKPYGRKTPTWRFHNLHQHYGVWPEDPRTY